MIGRIITIGVALATAGFAVGMAIGSSLNPIVKKPIFEVNIGDLVQWNCHGRFVFENPRIVTEVLRHHDGTAYIFVENERTGIPIEEVVVIKRFKNPR